MGDVISRPGLMGPTADRVAREVLGLDEDYRVFAAGFSEIEHLEPNALRRAAESYDMPLLDAAEVEDLVANALIRVRLPAGLWLFGLHAEGKEEIWGVVPLSPAEREQMIAEVNSIADTATHVES